MRGVYRYEPLRFLKDMVDMIFFGLVGYGIGVDKNWKYYITIFIISWLIRIFLTVTEKRLWYGF